MICMSKIRVFRFVIVIMTLVAIFVVIMFWHAITASGNNRPHSNMTFSEEKWKTETNHRYSMIDSLITEKCTAFKTADDVVRLLGIPEVSWMDGGMSNIMYSLGTQRDYPVENTKNSSNPANIDIWYLQFQFTNGLVIKYRVTST